MMIAAHFEPGMDVSSSDGTTIGKVAEVWVWKDSHGFLPTSRMAMADYGPITGTVDWLASSPTGCLQVVKNAGRVSREDRFVWFGAVRTVTDGRVELSCTGSDWSERFPDALPGSSELGELVA